LFLLGALRKFGSIIFGLTCAPAAFHAYKSMQKRSDEDWRQVCTGAVGAGALLLGSYGLGAIRTLVDVDVLIYICMDRLWHINFLTLNVLHTAVFIAGSLSFGPETDGDILVNLRGRFADAFKLLFVIHLLL
jgi:hypothetical protein